MSDEDIKAIVRKHAYTMKKYMFYIMVSFILYIEIRDFMTDDKSRSLFDPRFIFIFLAIQLVLSLVSLFVERVALEINEQYLQRSKNSRDDNHTTRDHT